MSATARGGEGGAAQPETLPAGGPEPLGVGALPGASDALARGPIEASPRRGFAAWRMGLVVSASALCGGIAVVLWNRRLLARMRESPEPAPAEPYCWEDDA